MSETSAPNPPQMKKSIWDRPLAEVNATIRKAEKGDKAALSEVKGWLSKPGTAEALSGNPAREALRLLVEKYTPNPVIREATSRTLSELRKELSGPSPTPLEKLLIDRVVATWMHLQILEAALAGKESFALATGNYYQKAISSAQKRHLAAIKGLAEVRRLALPAFQINIAKRQVNVATGTMADVSSDC